MGVITVCDWPVWHGYTGRDLHRLARIAVSTAFGRAVDVDATEMWMWAWDGITELLATADQPPIERALIDAGRRAVNTAARDYQRHRGGYEGWAGEAMPRYAAYWHSEQRRPGHDEVVVERLAVRQVLAVLHPRQRQAVEALAAFDDYIAAAASMGLTQGGYNCQLRRARRALLALWFEGETPAARPRDRRVMSHTTVGPRCGTAAGYYRHRRHRETACQPCRSAVAARRRAERRRSPAA